MEKFIVILDAEGFPESREVYLMDSETAAVAKQKELLGNVIIELIEDFKKEGINKDEIVHDLTQDLLLASYEEREQKVLTKTGDFVSGLYFGIYTVEIYSVNVEEG